MNGTIFVFFFFFKLLPCYYNFISCLGRSNFYFFLLTYMVRVISILWISGWCMMFPIKCAFGLSSIDIKPMRLLYSYCIHKKPCYLPDKLYQKSLNQKTVYWILFPWVACFFIQSMTTFVLCSCWIIIDQNSVKHFGDFRILQNFAITLWSKKSFILSVHYLLNGGGIFSQEQYHQLEGFFL